jgi:hypothetical protein
MGAPSLSVLAWCFPQRDLAEAQQTSFAAAVGGLPKLAHASRLSSRNRPPLRKARLERRAIRRLAVRGQYELDRQVEQRTEPSDRWFVVSLADVV